jgi:polysaccharide biosynthesis protein PslH
MSGVPMDARSGSSRRAIRRPRLLFLAQTLPFPPDGGVKIRTYNILRLLARSFDVSLLCFYRREEGLTQRDVDGRVEALRELADVRAFPIPQEHDRIRLAWDHLRSLVRGRVYTVFSYESADFRRALEGLLTDRDFDLVHADSLDLSGYFPALGDLPIVCTHHDATSIQLRRRGEQEGAGFRGAYIRHQSALMAREEQQWCGRIEANVVVSETDLDTLRGRAPGGRFIVVANGVDTDYFQPAQSSHNGIVCVGSTAWFPNRDALQHFAEDILPHVRSAGVNPAVQWVGWASAEDIRAFRESHAVELTGRVDDIRPFVASAACYVVPIRVGGGTRVKILDAWAMGKAIVSTTIGCEGLDAVDGENIMIRDEPEDFAAAVRRVLDDEDLRNRLGAAGRRTVESTYSWDVISRALTEHYLALIGPATAIPPAEGSAAVESFSD